MLSPRRFSPVVLCVFSLLCATSVFGRPADRAQLLSEIAALRDQLRLNPATVVATGLPLPVELGGTQVWIQDREGKTPYARLLAVTRGQTNLVIPPEVANGPAILNISRPDGHRLSENILIVPTAPGLFTANADGRGVPAAVALRVRGGEQSYEPVARFDDAQAKYVAAPIDLGAEGEQVFLILFGTGIRFRRDLGEVRATIDGVEAPVTFAGPQGGAGLDQVNLLLQRALAGRGAVGIVLEVGGRRANPVTVNIR